MQKIRVSCKQYLSFNIRGAFMNPLYLALSRKTLLLALFSFFFTGLAAQQRTKIILQAAKTQHTDVKTNITYLRNPTFRQDNAILTCDSAVFFTDRNYFEAYKNVHINQADTINIYSERLNYDGNKKVAHLTEKVRLEDRTSILTTNILDYQMVPKIGTYIEGGKITNKDAVITSKNGFYFANSRDAYFRYNVLVVTEQSVIKSDTLRYNTFSNWAYFYGPTNIKEKDGGNLYTENGAYNTKTMYAYFGKKNLYTSGTKSLKGDSLYYDGIAGYGKAVRNIVFKDTLDKMLMRGQLGYYYKKDQRTVVTKNAYAGMGTNDSITVNEVKVQDSIWIGADTLETQMVLQKSLKLINGPIIQKDNELGVEERVSSLSGKGKTEPAKPAAKKPASPLPAATNPSKGKQPKGNKNLDTDDLAKPPIAKDSAEVSSPGAKDSLQKNKTVPKDSIAIKKADSVLKKTAGKLNIDTLKGAAVKDTTIKSNLKSDSLNLQKTVKTSVVKTAAKPGTKKTVLKDSLPVNPMDTVLSRTIKAYHHVNVFKSDMQAVADSLFYTAADSTLRWYKNPIIWAQGSQQTGDTIYLQLRNKKISSVQVIRNAFSVNVEADSAKFNQIKGKILTGFFKDGNLSRLYVDGNAESVYFTKTQDGKKYDKMNQTISSRIKITFKDSKISDVVPIKDVEGATTPVADLKQDVLLTGFIWKPELRPRSKRDITNPKAAVRPKKPVPKAVVKDPKKTVKDAALKLLKGNKIQVTPGTVSQLIKAADSLQLPKKVPVQVTDTAVKALPAILKKADSLIKQPVLLEKQ